MGWSQVGNIRGPQGTPGSTGTPGAAAPTDLPSYAPAGLGHYFNPALGVYNLKPSNSRKTLAGLSKVMGGGRMSILAVGDSSLIGYNGTNTVDFRSAPRRMAQILAQQVGALQAGTGVTPCTGASTLSSDRFTTTGTVDRASVPGAIRLAAGATITFTPEQPGTVPEVYYRDNSPAFTVQVDGGAAVNVTPGGTNTVQRWQGSAVADGIHTIKVNAASASTDIVAMRLDRSTGIAVSNLGYGGSKAGSGGAAASWTDATFPGIQTMRKGAFDAAGVTPDLLLIVLGGNDKAGGDTDATVTSAIATIRGWYPTADCVLAVTCGLTTVTQAAWDSFVGSMYTLADALDCPLVDWRARMGYASTAASLGLIGADGFHESAGQSLEWGRQLASLYTGGGAGVYVGPSGAISPTYLPDGAVDLEY